MRISSHSLPQVYLQVGVFAALTFLSGGTCQAQAQQTPAATNKLPEVTVIGEVLPDPQSKPVSATFLSSDVVEAFRVKEPQDITRLVPNQFATDSGSRSFGDVYTTRGLANTVFFGAPATTVYVDDVPFGETFTYAQRLSAINSVESFRGPQPTLVGRNAYGGLINIRSRRPTNVFEGEANYSYGSYNANTADAWLMGPLIGDSLGFRIGGQYDSHSGYLRNPKTGASVDDQEHWGVNAGLFWKPADGWEVSLTGSYDEFHDGAPRLTSLDRKTGFYTVSSDVAGKQNRTLNNEALRVSFENKNFKFLSVTSHRGFDLDPYNIDLDFTASPFGSISLTQNQEIWSQEFRFSSNDPKANWQWNTGLYGSTSRIQGSGLRSFNYHQPTTTLTVTQFNQPIPTPFGTFIIPLTARSTSQSDSAISVEQLTTHTLDEKAAAIFGDLSYKGWDPLTIHVGGRLDWVQRSLTRDKSTGGQAVTNTVTSTTIDPVPGFPPFPSPPLNYLTTITPIKEPKQHISLQDEWVHFTPTVGLDLRLNDHILAYAKTTYAFKPGGFSAYADDAKYVPFDEEQTLSTEAGLKTEWLNGKLTANLAWFYNSVKNYQVERSFTTTNYAVFNAARARIYGLEFETRYAICPQLDFLGSFGWTHARLTDYTDPVSGRDLSGTTPPFVPEFDAVAALEFHLEKGFFTRVEYLATGNTKFDDFNRSEFQQGGYGLLSASIGWRAKNWSVSLYGSNLTQEQYYTNMNPEIRTGAVGIPREFGVRVGVKF